MNNGASITYTATNTFTAGQSVSILGISPVAYNISGIIATAFSNQFTITVTATTTSYVSGGTATVIPNGNLIEWQDNSGTPIAYVGPAGSINFRGSSTFTSNGRLYILPASNSNSLIVDSPIGNTSATSIIKSAASQTSDLTQWQSSTGAIQLRVNSSGQIQSRDTAIPVIVRQNAAKSATITTASTGGGIVTYTATNTFVAGEVVTITGVVSTGNSGATAGSGFNLTAATILSASATQFTVTNALSDTYTSGGTANSTAGADLFQVQDSSATQLFRVISNGVVSPNVTATGQFTASNASGPGFIQTNGLVIEASGGTGQIRPFVGSSTVRITTNGNTGVVLTVNQATGGGTSDLQRWTNETNTVLARVDSLGNITATNLQLDIIPIDDLTYQFDGIQSRFPLNLKGLLQTVLNPFRLLITLDGIIQSVSLPEYVWGSPFSRDGLILDSEGQMAFSEVPPIGTTFVGRVQSGTTVSSTTYSYPFKAMDILLGAY